MNYAFFLKTLAPEVVLTFGALIVLLHDLLGGRDRSPAYRVGAASVLGFVAVAISAWMAASQSVPLSIEKFIMIDSLAWYARLGILGLTGLTILLIGGTSKLSNAAEQVALTLFAAVGFLLMSSAQNLLIAFLSFELASVTLYVLAGFDKKNPASAEAGMKYFLFGATAAAFMLFGLSLIYGITGAIDFPTICEQFHTVGGSLLLSVALLMVFVGFAYKAAAAPFHLWAPDAYQGAPCTSAALIASASKVAGFTLVARFLMTMLPPDLEENLSSYVPSWSEAPAMYVMIALMISASLILGNVGALAQKNLRRLIAYSAISHAGILLLAVIMSPLMIIVSKSFEFPVLLYYLLTYGVATVGIFGVVAVLENNGGCQNISDLRGLWRRSPLLSVCLLVFVLSLAGIPPLAGFYAKFVVFYQSFAVGSCCSGVLAWIFNGLTFLGVAMSVLGLYYYLVVLKAALVESSEEGDLMAPIRVPFAAGLVLVLCVAATVLLGVYPGLLG